jgi:PAS domain S-box-containing protein
MTNGIKSDREHIEGALEAADMAWWSLEFPSGALTFSRHKTEMLGYDAKDFVHFMHFTDLIHPEDKDQAMQAMKDHYTGKVPVYETTYRIKASDGTYKKFYDKGKIVERTGDSFVVAGVVSRVD